MGRFATTAALYEALRPPYPPEFFRVVARRLALSGRSALIDLGTGPGLLALGLAPYVGRIVGVDPEPEMLAAARNAAARAGREFTLIEGKAEALPADIGVFDIVTIGRALHWMDREATLALLDRLVGRDGVVAVCTSFPVAGHRNPWIDEYNAARRAWSPSGLWTDSTGGERTHRDLAGFFQGSAFRLADPIMVETRHDVSVGDLARRILTFSSSSPRALGDKVEAMLEDVEQRLARFSHEGMVSEALMSLAQIATR
ncbi:class I SAM-dependent methyltransferase [Bradyrhizobium sp.]|uniref:class I SAM-dependent methyltransferase n=1 Tax=Bradyrhizobium sp. TaxID=376 RepID=UPI00238A0010|nr:class I SAM-dependent methyltransferase [Bradyrhizobium sp.]MDE2376612.1 class I SAM-dependent methyltransferase [Bradyrhizobium sp.]